MSAWGRLASLRQRAYRLLSASFLPPEPERWARMQAAAALAQRQDRWARGLPCFALWRECLASLRCTDPALLAEAHQRLFSPGGPVPLSESSYVVPDPLTQAEVVADVQRAYLRAGLRPSSAHEPDHISVELEYMSYLAGLEATAWERGDLREVRHQLKRQRRFLGNHLWRWLPGLVRRLEGASAPQTLLRGGRAAWGLACHDYDLTYLLDTELATVMGGEP